MGTRIETNGARTKPVGKEGSYADDATLPKHLCDPENRFIAPTTFPDVHTLEDYAEDHGRIMEQVNDLHIVGFDVLFAKDDRVCVRYSAEGAHRGQPHGDIQPTGRTARWSAAALFRVRDGMLSEFIKEWNKLSMWEQLGWPVNECLTGG